METLYYLFRDLQDGSVCMDFFRTREEAEQAELSPDYEDSARFNSGSPRSIHVGNSSGIDFTHEYRNQATDGLTAVYYLVNNDASGVEFYRDEEAWGNAFLKSDYTQSIVVNRADQVFYVQDATGIDFVENAPQPSVVKPRRNGF